MSEISLSKLAPLEPRSIWKHEAHDFTQWLEAPENFELLAQALHFQDAEVEAREQSIGDFYADLVARDREGLILIENQLEQTDHNHLGKILTYLSGLEDALKVVWISTRIRDEHRAAIDWLNSNTPGQFAFFAVELEVYRIDDSAAAPYFHVAARPNEWSRHLSARAKHSDGTPRNAREVFYKNYWTHFSEVLAEHDPSWTGGTPPKRQWWRFGIGRAGFDLSVSATTKHDFIATEIYIHNDSEKRIFDHLHASKALIEQDFGGELDWQRLDGVGSRIAIIRRDAGVEDEENWPEFAEWYIDKMERLRKAFAARIIEIDLDAIGGPSNV